MKSKIEELEKSREMRKEGYSVREIAKILKVSKGSVSAWVRDIKLTEEQMSKLLCNRTGNNKLMGGVQKEKFRQLRRSYQQEGRELAKLRDPDFYAGCMLYWAEGNKSRNSLAITNSDPNMLKYFLSFLYKFFKIEKEDIKIVCHYYSCNGLSNIEVEDYWIKQLNISRENFNKTSVNRNIRTSSEKRQERTKYGVVKILINDVRILQMIYGALQEIGKFENNEWLG